MEIELENETVSWEVWMATIDKLTNKKELNPKWLEYNDMMNEGQEGYNPYNKYI